MLLANNDAILTEDNSIIFLQMEKKNFAHYLKILKRPKKRFIYNTIFLKKTV